LSANINSQNTASANINRNLTLDEKAHILNSLNFTVEKPESDIFDELNAAENISVWESPIPFRNMDLPQFPVNELPIIIDEYVRAVSETTQTSPDMAAVASLAIG